MVAVAVKSRSASLAPPEALETRVLTRQAAATRDLGARLAGVAEPGDLVCLVGDLGAGKTQLAKGFGVGLGVDEVVNSPTFVLMSEHAGRLPMFHLDLYRLDGAADAFGGGLLDERQADGVTLVEWAERLGPVLPPDRLDVIIEGTGDEPRRITVRAASARYRRYVDAVVGEGR